MTGPSRQSGYAMVVVLWTVALLALLSAQLIGAARQRTGLAQLLRTNAKLEAAADGAVFDTVMAVIQNNGVAPALRRAVAIGGVVTQVGLADEAGRLNPNTASLDELRQALTGAGIDPPTANFLARAIVDWRTRMPDSLLGLTKAEQYRRAGRSYLPPNQPFATFDELGLVLGMTPDILARLRDVLSVVREGGRAPSADAIDQSDPNDEPGGAAHATALILANKVYRIDALASQPDGTRFRRRAVVRIKMVPEKGETPYEVLAWDTPDG